MRAVSDTAGRWYRVAALLLLGGLAPARGSEPSPTAELAGFVDDRGAIVGPAIQQRPLRLLIFGYASCPDVCPLTLAAVHAALARLDADATAVDPLFVTVDPARDTEERLHTYVSAFDARIRGLRGSEEVLRRLARALHVQYGRETLEANSADYPVSHPAVLFLLDRHLQVIDRIDGGLQGEKLASEIVLAVCKALPGPAPPSPTQGRRSTCGAPLASAVTRTRTL